MALDHQLPVWTIRPNWAQSITERLQWLSDVLRSKTGQEQGITLRLSPRRSIEATFNPTDRERTFLNLSLQRLGRIEWMVPLWFHVALLDSTLVPTDTTIMIDTVGREFTAGGMALIVGATAFEYETVRIDSVTENSITLIDEITRDWPAGTKIHPLRRAWIDATGLESLTSRIGSARLRFDIDRGNDLEGGAEEFPLYRGLPLISHAPNWGERVETVFSWQSDQFDGKTGLRHVQNVADRAFQSKRYTLMLHGRDEHMQLRELLYRLRGRAAPAWIPSYDHDLIVARSATAMSQILDIQKVGINYVGGITPDVAHILIGNDEAVEIEDTAEAIDDNEERLILVDELSRNIAVGESASFIQLARLDGDTIAIEHLTDTNGTARVSLTFRAFSDGRDGSAQGDYPIPETSMNSTACGAVVSSWDWHYRLVVTSGWDPVLGDIDSPSEWVNLTLSMRIADTQFEGNFSNFHLFYSSNPVVVIPGFDRPAGETVVEWTFDVQTGQLDWYIYGTPLPGEAEPGQTMFYGLRYGEGETGSNLSFEGFKQQAGGALISVGTATATYNGPGSRIFFESWS